MCEEWKLLALRMEFSFINSYTVICRIEENLNEQNLFVMILSWLLTINCGSENCKIVAVKYQINSVVAFVGGKVNDTDDGGGSFRSRVYRFLFL